MDLEKISLQVEALIFATDKPLSSQQLTDIINHYFQFMDNDKISLDLIESLIAAIKVKYDKDFYPFNIKESGGGYQFLTKKEYYNTIGILNQEKYTKKLSAAALETLSIITYKQPITKAEIEKIRGVNSDYSLQKLLDKELIIIAGRNDELPGRPLLYKTSNYFMDYLGIQSIAQLPRIEEVLQIDQSIQQDSLNEK